MLGLGPAIGLYGEYARARSSPQVARYVERQLDGFINANVSKLCQIAGAFDGQWGRDLAVCSRICRRTDGRLRRWQPERRE